MMLGYFMETIRYIRNGLPNISFGEVLFIGGTIVAIAKWVETLTGKKYLAAVLWHALKDFLQTPSNILKEQKSINARMAKIEKEVTLNGGSSMKDGVTKLSLITETNTILLQDINMRMKVSDELDNMMKFQMDETGYLMTANKAYLDFFGFTESDLRAHNWENTIEKRSLQDVQVKLARAIENKSDFITTSGIVDSEGKIYKCRIRGIALLNNNVLRGYYGTVEILPSKDVTDSKP